MPTLGALKRAFHWSPSLSLSLGFLGHARRARPKKPLTPEVFNSVHLIEAYLDFLKVGYFSAQRFSPR